MTILMPNPIGVLVATFAVMMLGWIWFEKLFGARYAQVLGRAYPSPSKPPPLFIAGPALCMLATTIAGAVLMRWLAVSSLGEAIGFGLLAGVGLLGATAVNMGINPNIPRPLAYGVLSACYFALAGVIIAVVLFLVG